MQRSLDGFSVIELVGLGATGEVWRARPDSGGPDVALKWLTAEAVDIEALLVSRLRDFAHPHVAQVLDLRRDGPTVVLVQEFVQGVSLAALLSERERLSSAEVVTLLTPVAEALGAAHAAGLLNGNLTPDAILLTPDGRPILIDLGIGASASGLRSATTRLPYLDPSVARGGPVTTAADVFGIAAIGLHALTGAPPWAGGGTADSWQLATEGRADLEAMQTGVPRRLADVIARGLCDQPDRRGSAHEFAEDVRGALEPEPLHLAGPDLWPDLAPVAPAEPADPATAGSDPVSFDIAGEVRRGSSARHAAAPGTRRERAARAGAGSLTGFQPLSGLGLATRVVPRRAIVGALVALAALTILVLGVGWNASNAVPAQAGGLVGEPSSGSAPAGRDEQPGSSTSGIDERALPSSAEGWAQLLTLLYERRALAFATGAVELLDQVFTADSPQLGDDSAELNRLVGAGQVLRGFAPRVLEVTEVTVPDGGQAALQVTDEFDGYESVPALDTGAAALATHVGRAPATVAMTLVLAEQGWRIQSAQRLS